MPGLTLSCSKCLGTDFRYDVDADKWECVHCGEQQTILLPDDVSPQEPGA